MEAFMSKNLSTVVESCVERVKEGLERALARAMEWTLHQSEEDAVSELARAEVVFLMAVSALAHLDAEVSGMLLKEIDRWSVFPRIRKYMSGKMDAEWEVPREILDRASRFAHVLEISGPFFVPPELRPYLAELLAEGAAGGDASLQDQRKRPRKDPRGSQQVEESSAGGQIFVDPQQERRYRMAARRRRSRKQGGRGQENKGKQAASHQQVPTPPAQAIAKPTPEPSKTQTPSYLLHTTKPTGAIPKVRQPAKKTKTPRTAASPPTEAFPSVRKCGWHSICASSGVQAGAAGTYAVPPAMSLIMEKKGSQVYPTQHENKEVRSRSSAVVDIAVPVSSPRARQITSTAVQAEEPQASAVPELSTSVAHYEEPQASAAPEETPAAAQPPPPQPRMSRLAAQRQLWEGVEKDDGQLVEGAVVCEADLNEVRADKGYRTPLALAASEGRVGAVRALIRLGAQLEVPTGEEKRTALHLASGGGHVAVVRELLAAGANLEAEDSIYKVTPLHLAVAQGHVAVVRELLSAGANLEAEGILKITSLNMASIWRYLDVVSELLVAGM